MLRNLAGCISRHAVEAGSPQKAPLDNLQFHQFGTLPLNHREGRPASRCLYKIQHQDFHLTMAFERVNQKT